MRTSNLRLKPSWTVLYDWDGRSWEAFQFSTKINLVTQRSSSKMSLLDQIILQDRICA